MEEGFIEEGDTAFSLEDSEIVASYEIVSARFGDAGDDSYRPGGRIELFSLTDLEGETRLAIRGDTVVRVETGDEADVINLSADTHGGEPGVSPYDGADVDANEAFVSVDSGPGNWIAEHDVSFVETNAGDDRIVMGARETVVVAGDGADTITAGATNSSYIEAGDGDDLVDLSAVEEAGLSVVQGGAGNDTFVGGAGADLYFGGTHMFGAGGDNASGGDGADSLFGSTGADVIDGGEGDDTIGGARAYVPLHDYTSGFPALDERDYADRSADTLLGGSGDDVLLGGAEDVMTGGGGEDQYGVYWTQNPEGDAGPAVVTDFEPGVEALQITVHVDDFAGLTDSPEQEITLDLVEVDGNTQVMFQGQLLVELQGVTGVSAADVSANVFVPYDRW
ncbi:MAG: hypothetical protein JJ868_04340 [Shimia sp.]|uniref:calcium-binding protein n=1 Tax=Shimia sp. TaxID=1954381 RepID=UPI001B203E66|nr:hypothetical protein [Shimia sp.]MBO6896584.1 hypothetical protein [Shimia sp.]